MASVTVGIQWSWICSTITNHRKMNTLYEWKVHATIPVAGISSEDAWERYQTNYMESLNEPEAFWTTVSSLHISAFLTICKNFSMDSFQASDNVFIHIASEQLCIMDLSFQESPGWILHRRYLFETWKRLTHYSHSQNISNGHLSSSTFSSDILSS